jgi:antitoxin component YwqK of YwqJK toxin-antitoxin module
MNRILLITLLAILTFGCSHKKVIEATYENGNPRVVRYYHKKAGKLMVEREIVYYQNKQVKMDGKFKNEEREGIWKAWYENGILWSEGEYKAGKRNGPGIAYHPNGKKYIEGIYRDDARVGAWKFYDTTGVLTHEINFDLVPRMPDREPGRQE